MSETVKNIVSICHQLIEKPTNIHVKDRSYEKVVREAEKNPDANQEIVCNENSDFFYIHVKNNITISLFKELSSDEIARTYIDKSVLKTLNTENKTIKKGGWYTVAMKKGDILINFNDTPISEKISKSKDDLLEKYGAIIKGDECFIETYSPASSNRDNYGLIPSTQKDLLVIMDGLTELL